MREVYIDAGGNGLAIMADSDSAHMEVGEKDLAITNYEKSLQLDPKNQNAVAQLKKLKGPK